jgi:hypothetical protein
VVRVTLNLQFRNLGCADDVGNTRYWRRGSNGLRKKVEFRAEAPNGLSDKVVSDLAPIPRRLKPESKQSSYRSGKPLRHPKSSAEAISSAITKLQNFKIKLADARPYLIDHYTDHEHEVNPQRPEEKHLGAGQPPPRTMMVLLGGN